MKKKNVRKYFFTSMGISLCFSVLSGMFLTADYNNRKMSGESVIASSQLVEKLNKSDESGTVEKLTDTIFNEVIYPFEEMVAEVSEKILDFYNAKSS